jgi:hypothetical protein
MRKVIKQEKGSAQIGFDKVWVFDFDFFEELNPGKIILVFSDFGENLEFVESRLRMGFLASLDFHSGIFVGELIMNKPDGGEVTPTKFLDDNVLLVEFFAQYHRMVSFRTVVSIILALRIMLVLIIFFLDHLDAIYYKFTTKQIIFQPIF